MDESVIRAMAIWPDVPDCYGWLQLNGRGLWFLQGERISNQKVIDFIGRNFQKSESGSYFFQNGPQRVHIELAIAPFVAFIPETEYVQSVFENQFGERISAIKEVVITPEGTVYLGAECGCCVIDDRYLSTFLSLLVDKSGHELSEDALGNAIDAVMGGRFSGLHWPGADGLLRITPLASDEVESHFGFVRVPSAATD